MTEPNEEKKKTDISKYVFKYLAPLSKNKLVILLLFLITVFIALPIGYLIKPVYVSSVACQVLQPYSKIVQDEDRVDPIFARPSYIITEAERLQSNMLVGEVLKSLSEDDKIDLKNPLSPPNQVISRIQKYLQRIIGVDRIKKIKQVIGMNTAPPSEERLEKLLIERIKERVSISTSTKNAIIWITASSFRREVAYTIVQSYIRIWNAMNKNENIKEISDTIQFLAEQKTKALQQYNEQTAKLKVFRIKHQIPPEVTVISNLDIQLELEQLLSNLEIAKDHVILLNRKYIEMQMVEKGIADNIKILVAPEMPIDPSKNKARIFLSAIAFLGLFSGIFLVLITDFIKGPIRHESDITKIIDLPVLTSLPKMRKHRT